MNEHIKEAEGRLTGQEIIKSGTKMDTESAENSFLSAGCCPRCVLLSGIF